MIVRRSVMLEAPGLAGCLAACLLAGCAVGPDYRRPPVDAPAAFRFDAKDASDTANTAWWQQFQDPELDRLIGIALAENKDVQVAAARIDEFLGQFRTTRSALFPQVGAGLSAQRQRIPPGQFQATPGFTSGVIETYSLDLSVSWEIDVFGKRRRETEAARANLLASEEGRRATILTLVSTVASSYVALRQLDRQLEIAKETARTRLGSFELFRERFEGGTVSELEVSQTKADYEAALVAIPPIETQIAQAENALAVLLGRNPGPIRRGAALVDLKLPLVPAGLPSQLVERRPDLRQAEQQLIAANAQIGVARAQYFPVISLTGLFGSASTAFSGLFKGANRAWNYGANTTMPIFTAGGIGGTVETAEAVQREALLRYQQAIQVAFREVSDSLIAHAKAREQLVHQDDQVVTLRTYLELARLRYENGYTSYIEVLDAERNLFNAEVAQTQTMSNVVVSLVNLYKAMGGGWVTQAEQLTSGGTPAAGQGPAVAQGGGRPR
jgi:multidrug efflux system outer membrane protein